jgi:hypothetical protein
VIARTIRMISVSPEELFRPEGWTAPNGWRIVNSEFVTARGSGLYRITLVSGRKELSNPERTS